MGSDHQGLVGPLSATYGAADWADELGTNEIRVTDDGLLRLYCGRVANVWPRPMRLGQPTGETKR